MEYFVARLINFVLTIHWFMHTQFERNHIKNCLLVWKDWKNAFYENFLIIFRKITILLLLFQIQNIYHDLSFTPHKIVYKMGKDRHAYRIRKTSPQTNTYNFWLLWKFYNPANGSIIIFNICEGSLFFFWKEGEKWLWT